MKALVKIFTCILCAFTLVGCAYKHQQIMTPNGNIPAGLTTKQVQEAIKVGCSSYNWEITRISGTEVEAKMIKTNVGATVRIDFDNSNYSISLVESTGLMQNSSKNEIHSRYNTWVTNLKNAIDTSLKNETVK
ncbi:MAG: hypothetical protein SPK70_06885 [Succinivibrio dextrinosolvens]|nr:hypothetical protein [Succinivibrio dextrinosolvens]MDY6466509.1 hypothetical protein [Succinivibrio dextrinosolvens]MDY6470773.1 hypothetical protein [Succinivibrio dextrinosolvens]